jgi:hypothetical protein
MFPNQSLTLEMETFALLHLAKCSGAKRIGHVVSQYPLNTIRAAAVLMVFADRSSGAFITADRIQYLEKTVGGHILDVLINSEITLDA